ncbi:MAG: hypothetical protein P8M18_08475, partial [Woeseiaceae bacterium]|nr:hypothetical protein [Woeseiaceae bacterium]
YVTNMPVVFGISFLAISKRTFDRLSAGDQVVVSEVLNGVYADIDQKAPAESESALQALHSIGITHVEPEEGQFSELQKTMSEFNRQMAVDGAYPLGVYEEMLGYIVEFRSGKSAAMRGGN